MGKYFYYSFHDESHNLIEKDDELTDIDNSGFGSVDKFMEFGDIRNKHLADINMYSLETIQTAILEATESLDPLTLLRAMVRPWSVYSGDLEWEIIQMTKLLDAALRFNENNNNRIKYISFYMM